MVIFKAKLFFGKGWGVIFVCWRQFFFSHIYATFALGSSNRIVLAHATCL